MTTKVDGSNGIVFPDGTTQATAASSFGLNQTWTNVLSSRTSGNTYTNSTGKPIMVIVQGAATSGFSISINGSTIFNYSGNIQTNSSFVVPNSQTYSVSMPAGINYWYELR